MPIIKHAYPILEHDTHPDAIIRPNRHGRAMLPPVAVITFFGEVLEAFAESHECSVLNSYDSEMRRFPIYGTTYRGVPIALVQGVVGSGSIAMMADYLIGHGVKTLLACGGCGVLDPIPAGDVIIPTSALRDEGASYHYLPPARTIDLDTDVISLLTSVCAAHGVPFLPCRTWTTDAFYRETPDMVTYRKEEGCRVVEMECATLAAVSRFRGVKFGQYLYSGDVLADFDNYDERNWAKNGSAREKLFHLTLEAAAESISTDERDERPMPDTANHSD